MADRSLGPLPLDRSNWSLGDISLCGLDARHHHCGRRDERSELEGLANSFARHRLGRRYHSAQLHPRPKSSREMVVYGHAPSEPCVGPSLAMGSKPGRF